MGNKTQEGARSTAEGKCDFETIETTCFMLVLSSFLGYNDYLTLEFRKLLKLAHHILSFSDKDITTNSPLNNGKLP
jgi:hypothetical protein